MRGTVLVVDINDSTRELLTDSLAVGGYSVRAAASGSEGLIHIGEEQPDLIIAGMQMPEMDGIEFTRRARGLCNAPVLILSGQGEVLLPKGQERLFDGLIQKPVALSDLYSKVEKVMSRKPCRMNSALKFGS